MTAHPRSIGWALVLAAAIVLGASAARAEVIVNGSFESVSGPAINNWVQVLATSELAADYPGTSPYGDRLLGFNVDVVLPGGSATQDFVVPLDIGVTYQVTFAYAQFGGAANDQTLVVTLNTTSVPIPQQLFTDPTPAAELTTGWERGSFTFFSDGTVTGITFADTSITELLAEDSDLLVDDVSIVAVPEPVSAATLLAGAGVLGLRRRRAHG